MRVISPEAIKARTPLRPLCAALGIVLGPDDYALCPFHESDGAGHRPSFYIWQGEDDDDRWWCQPCGFGGDQIALIRRVRGLGFSEALFELDRLADNLPEYTPAPRRARDPQRDRQELIQVVTEAMEKAARINGYISLFNVRYITESDGRPDDRFVWDDHLRSLGWGVDEEGRVIFPYWTAEGELIGAKKRTPEGSRSAVYGSRFSCLYLSWIPRAHDAVLLCEGETDCGWATFHGRGLIDVRGIPGAHREAVPPEEFVRDLMAWPTIYLALDHDDTGIRATTRWLEALTSAGHRDVRLCRLPPGHDVRRARIPLERLLADAL